MKVTALEEYGLRCMLLFTEKGDRGPLTIHEISASEKLSVPYAGKLLMILKQAGLVRAVRGRKGGYVLTKPPEQIQLREIFAALGEPFFGNHHCRRYAGDSEICVHDDDCKVRNMWSTFDRFISGILEKVSLADLASGRFNYLESKENLPRQKESA
ncbi:MAG TPA: Rrf2 family transcriptional regulator [candidate division Zixibacteria bacterium]|nr:Rrf2 family transcriptional regulator [candidate division Zixibacteria bacterium]